MENHRTTKVTVDNKVVELQEDRCLFARMMLVCYSRPEINIAKAVAVFEFSLVPPSLFASMLHCSTNGALMNTTEKRVNLENSTTEQYISSSYKNAVKVMKSM